MSSIKNFTYLDDYKMYSISSQILEGLTEYIVKSANESLEEGTEQKGSFGSGQIMADLIVRQKNETQKIFLHDYSYNLFEKKLIESDKVLIIDESNFEEKILGIGDYNFVKVTGRIIFNDTKQIEHIITSFNELGMAFTYLTNNSSLEEKNRLKENFDSNKDKNQKSKAEAALKTHLSELKKIAKASGLQMNDDFLTNLKYMLNYGYGGQFEVQMPFTNSNNPVLFSSLIKRDKLKEDESFIIKKHGRTSEKAFTVFGILTQVQPARKELELFHDKEDKNMKEAVLNMITHLTNMENVFTGKLPNEFVIDPIAIYNEI